MADKNSNFKSVDHKLIDIGRFAILGVQLNGYLPLCISKNKVLSLKYWSKEYLYSITVTILALCFTFYAFVNRVDYFRLGTYLSRTEIVVLACTASLTTISCMILRIHGTINATDTLRFWKRNCDLILTVSKLGFHLDENIFFSRIKRSTLNIWLFYHIVALACLLGIISIALCTKSTTALNFWMKLSPQLEISLTFTIGQVFLFLYSLLHVSHGLWITFFLELYSACFNMISCKLKCVRDATNLETPEGESFVDIELNKCCQLYHTVEEQIQDFNSHFPKRLLFEVSLCIANILIHTFFIVSWGMRGLEVEHLLISIPIIVFTVHLYHIGTKSSQLTSEAYLILHQLHQLYQLNLNFFLKHKVQLLPAKNLVT